MRLPHIWHSWREITKRVDYDFEGQVLQKVVPSGYRFCKVCKKYQKSSHTTPDGMAIYEEWDDCTEAETNIIREKYVRIGK